MYTFKTISLPSLFRNCYKFNFDFFEEKKLNYCRSKYADIQNVKAGLTAPVRAEIDAHLGNLAHNVC